MLKRPVMQFVTPILLATMCLVGYGADGKKKNALNVKVSMTEQELIDWAKSKGLETATFGTGCFWCTESCLQQLKGVEKVVSGYSGGHVDNPTYEQVCSKLTGHAEVVQVFYDPAVVSYDKLLEKFWMIHDPTSKNRQGADVGPQYRSVIFYHNEEQRDKAESYKKKLDEAKVYNKKIVTEIEPMTKFWPAEDYHQNYFNLNPQNPYCQAVVGPKLEKFKKVFASELK